MCLRSSPRCVLPPLTSVCNRSDQDFSAPHTASAGTNFFADVINPMHMHPGNQSISGSNALSAAALPPSFPTKLVQARPASVTERFGQVTPPENSIPELRDDRKSSTGSIERQQAGGKAPKLNKSERARNAANQRHAKSKLARQQREARREAGSGSDIEGSGEESEGKRETYREKNRLAAAKCRAKKKENVEGLEDKHRHLSAQNNFLKREERTLRDELSMLRTAALQHTPAARGCICGGLHEYNRKKASQVAFGLGGPLVSSPSDGMRSSVHSPAGLSGPMSRSNSMAYPTPDPMVANMIHRPQSFSGPLPIGGFPPGSPSGPMMSANMHGGGGDHGQDFPSFLHGCSDGRHAFA